MPGPHLANARDGDQQHVDLGVGVGRDPLLTGPGKQRQIQVIAFVAPLRAAACVCWKIIEVD
ncbi:MAG TPA: hypothetical protein VEZ12_13245 [Herpetosiphonaceae bacterium]|nr:hypothetical protein [Herpetosiphonaceae bacterium]